MTKYIIITLILFLILEQVIICFNTYSIQKYIDLGTFNTKSKKTLLFNRTTEEIFQNQLSKYLIEHKLEIKSDWVLSYEEINGMFVSKIFGGKVRSNLEYGKLETCLSLFNKWLDLELLDLKKKKQIDSPIIESKVNMFIELFRKKDIKALDNFLQELTTEI